MLNLASCPMPVRYRELWLPRAINGNATLPSARHNGHALTLTGARLATTADGVHFDGTLNSNINCGAIHNAQAKLWLSFRFKLDQAHAVGVASKYFMIKTNAGESIYLYLSTADGALHFTYDAAHFNIATAATSWNAGQMYHVIASTSSAAGVRLRVDNGTAVTDANLTALPAAGNLYLGNAAGSSHIGILTDVFMGTDDLTAAEETGLYNGIPPADSVHIYTLDEGRGVTANDRGSGANNGTLGSACTWAFGQVRQPVLSLDGINDSVVSSSGVSIANSLTAIFAMRAKNNYGTVGLYPTPLDLFIDANNRIALYNAGEDGANLKCFIASAGTTGTIVSQPIRLDDYVIMIETVSGSTFSAFQNGYAIGVSLGIPALPATAAVARIGASSGWFDISKPLFCAVVDGAFTAKQVLAYSRWLRDSFNLPISM